MLCSKLNLLCKLLSLSSSKIFLPLQKETLCLLNSHSPFHLASSPWQPLVCFLSLWILNYFYVCFFCDAFERTLDKKSGEWTTHPTCPVLSFSYCLCDWANYSSVPKPQFPLDLCNSFHSSRNAILV